MYQDSIECDKRNNLKSIYKWKEVTFKNEIIKRNKEWIEKTLYKKKTTWKRENKKTMIPNKKNVKENKKTRGWD